MHANSCSKTDMITVKDAYEELWRCRDFELSHFWQRSAFLGTFLIAVFAGYGSMIVGCLDHGLSNRPAVNSFCFGLTVVGVVLSLLWIMMAKGSKAWYERYEKAIHHFLEIAGVDTAEKKGELFENGADKIIAFAYGKDFKKYSDPVSSWLWNTKGGSYSPSRINIALGHLSLLIWVTLSSIHIAVAKGFVVSKVSEQSIEVSVPVVMIMVLVFTPLLVLIYSKQFLKSNILEENEKQ